MAKLLRKFTRKTYNMELHKNLYMNKKKTHTRFAFTKELNTEKDRYVFFLQMCLIGRCVVFSFFFAHTQKNKKTTTTMKRERSQLCYCVCILFCCRIKTAFYSSVQHSRVSTHNTFVQPKVYVSPSLLYSVFDVTV